MSQYPAAFRVTGEKTSDVIVDFALRSGTKCSPCLAGFFERHGDYDPVLLAHGSLSI